MNYPSNYDVYTILSLYTITASFAIQRYIEGDSDSVRSGFMIALLDFPIEYLNERFGAFWTVSDELTVWNIRSGFPVEVPLMFFYGGYTTTKLLSDERPNCWLSNRFIPALSCGILGAIGERVFNHYGWMNWESSWGFKEVSALYTFGCCSIFWFYDLSEREQKVILTFLIILAFLTLPWQQIKD